MVAWFSPNPDFRLFVAMYFEAFVSWDIVEVSFCSSQALQARGDLGLHVKEVTL